MRFEIHRVLSMKVTYDSYVAVSSLTDSNQYMKNSGY